jgi:hypothetical protein
MVRKTPVETTCFRNSVTEFAQTIFSVSAIQAKKRPGPVLLVPAIVASLTYGLTALKSLPLRFVASIATLQVIDELVLQFSCKLLTLA